MKIHFGKKMVLFSWAMEIIESKKKDEEHCYARNHKFSEYLVLRTIKSYRIISNSQKLSANSKVFLATL